MVISALINAQKANIDLVYDQACAIDLATKGTSKNVVEAVHTSVNPQVSYGVTIPYNQKIITEEGSWSEDGKIYTLTHEINIGAADGFNRIDLRGPNTKPQSFTIKPPVCTVIIVSPTISSTLSKFDNEHGFANSRARLRMTTLYQVAAANKGIVVGTGNKVEDFGVGFYTKYGDGGVDISPIADCNKTEVWEIGKELGILQEIIDAPPTDGLWDDGRTDEGQLGFDYQALEDAMINPNSPHKIEYEKIRKQNLHKMEPIPVCKIPS